jgi:hypothetical protein
MANKIKTYEVSFQLRFVEHSTNENLGTIRDDEYAKVYLKVKANNVIDAAVKLENALQELLDKPKKRVLQNAGPG